MTNLLTFSLPWVLAVANRLRGSDPWYWPAIGKSVFIGSVGCLFYRKTGGYFAPCWIAVWYMLGQSLGWGKYVGAIIVFSETCLTELNPWGNDALQKSFNQAPGGLCSTTIHYVTNLFYDHDSEYLPHCLLALSLRGLYWWGPVAIGLGLVGAVNIYIALIGLFILCIGFPMSVAVAAFIAWDCDFDCVLAIDAWSLSEYVYGFLHGLVFIFMFLF